VTDLFDVTTCPTCSGSGTVLAHSFIAHTSRRSDPETSQQAGKRHESDVRVLRPGTVKYAVLRTFVDRHRTAQEAAMSAVGSKAPVSSIEGARRRVSDLIRAGYLEVIDLGHNEGGSTAQVYRMTYAGMLALNRLREVS
jgi:hypothetical protein